MIKTMNNLSAIPDSPPSLSPTLLTTYLSLNSDMRRLFVKIYHQLWEYVCPLNRFVKHGGVLYSYWAVDLLRLRAGLTSSELAVLAYLYHLSNGGRNVVHSEKVYSEAVLPDLIYTSKQQLLHDIKGKGYINRLTRDPATPYLQRSVAWRPVFIKLTPDGIQLIEDMEKDLYKILVNNCSNDLTTGSYKKT